MDPITATLIVGSLIGTGLKVAGRVRQGKENRRVAKENASMARSAAADAVRRGAYDVFLRRLQARRMQGEQRAAIARSGISVGSGTAAMVEADALLAADLDSLVISTNARREAWGMRKQAEEYDRAAKRARTDAALGVTSDVVSGATHVAGVASTVGDS